MIDKIFISHSSQDKEIADKVISYLESHDQVCWIAPRDIPPGADWAESIIDGIDTSSAMILVVTPRLNDSPHIRREVERAVSKKIPIIPLIVEQTEFAKWLQYYISAHQWVDATDKSLFKKAMLDISEKLNTIIPSSTFELNKDTKEESYLDKALSSLQKNDDTGVSAVRNKRVIAWALPLLLVFLGLSFLLISRRSGNNNEVIFENDIIVEQLCFPIPPTQRSGIRNIQLKELHDDTIALAYTCAEYYYITTLNESLYPVSNTFISMDSISNLLITPISGEGTQGLACGIVDRNDGSNTSQESIGIYEFDIEGNFRCISTLDYEIFGDAVESVSCEDFTQSGNDVFTIASIIETQNHDSTYAVLTNITREGEFLSNNILMHFPWSESSANKFKCIQVENGVLAVIAPYYLRQQSFFENPTVFWVDTTATIRNIQFVENEGIFLLAEATESNIYGALLTLSSHPTAHNNGSIYFAWLDEQGNLVKSSLFDTPQQAWYTFCAADLANGDYICPVDIYFGLIQNNIESEVFEYSSTLLDSVFLRYHMLNETGAREIGCISSILGRESKYLGVLSAKNGPYLFEMRPDGGITSFQHLCTPIFQEKWEETSSDVFSQWIVKPGSYVVTEPFINTFGHNDSSSIDLNQNYMLSREAFSIHSSMKLEFYVWVSATVTQDHLVIGFLPSSTQAHFSDSLGPISLLSPRLSWSNYGLESASIEASYFNGDGIVECCSELSSGWLSAEEWNKIEICFTDSTAIFLINDSVFSETGSDLKLSSLKYRIMLFGSSMSSMHGIDDIRLLLQTDWFW